MRKRTAAIIFGVGLTVAAGAILVRYRIDISAARKRASEGSRLIETDRGPIEYAEAGTGIPIFCIHGTGGGFDQDMLFGRQLGVDLNTYRVIAPSRYGHLGTPMLDGDTSPVAQF